MGYVNQPPRPAQQLFENLFCGRGRDAIIHVLSDGLVAVVKNANRLIEDVGLLFEAKRYASAGFLLATADEEMAKSYILLDMCRLDFSRHESVLRALCGAFYNHITKHAYKQVHRFAHDHRDRLMRETDLSDLKGTWGTEIQRWWPGSLDMDGIQDEPDMPHETVWTREMPLYVDFYDEGWSSPENRQQRFRFHLVSFDEIEGSDFSKTNTDLGRLNGAHARGLYMAECLAILNDVFAKYYITQKTRIHEILQLNMEVAERLQSECGISSEDCEQFALVEWPLYDFLVNRDD